MQNLARILSALVTLSVALFALGCGGGGESSGTTASAAPDRPLSKREFIKRAEQICRAADERQYKEAVAYRERHEEELSKLEPIPAEERLIRLIVFPSIGRQVREIEALEVPAGEEKRVKALFTAMAAGMKKAENDPYAIEGEVLSEYPFDRYTELATKYGFNECRNLG